MLTDIHGGTVIIENQVPVKRGGKEGQASSDSKCEQLIGKWLQEAEKMEECSLQENGGSQEKKITLRENWQYLNDGEINSVEGKEGQGVQESQRE